MKTGSRIFGMLAWLGGLAMAGSAILVVTAARVGEQGRRRCNTETRVHAPEPRTRRKFAFDKVFSTNRGLQQNYFTEDIVLAN